MDDVIWKDFVNSIREAGEPTPFKSKAQKRYKAQRKKNDIYSSMAGHKNLSSGAPYNNKVKRAGTDRLRFQEEVEPESFEIHSTLAPDLWEGDKLKPKIADNLMKVATTFIESFPVDIKIKDVRLTGSLANYNWSNYSDVDLHIVVDFSQVDENTALVKSLFDNARMRWNNNHRITMKGYDVEIYVEDEGEDHVASGLYSIMNKKWLNRPPEDDRPIDFSMAMHKANDLEFQINTAANQVTAEKYKAATQTIKRLKQKIKNMRRAGLESPAGEFSVENIAFKILRREGLLDFLEDLKRRVYDEVLSVKEE